MWSAVFLSRDYATMIERMAALLPARGVLMLCFYVPWLGWPCAPFPPLELIRSPFLWPGRALLKSYSSTVEEAQTSKPGWPHAPLSFRPDSNFIFLYHPAVKKWTLFQDLPATNFIFLHHQAVKKENSSL